MPEIICMVFLSWTLLSIQVLSFRVSRLLANWGISPVGIVTYETGGEKN